MKPRRELVRSSDIRLRAACAPTIGRAKRVARLVETYDVQLFERARSGAYKVGNRVRAASADLAFAAARSAVTMGRGAAVIRTYASPLSGDILKTEIVRAYGEPPPALLDRMLAGGQPAKRN